MMDDKFPPSNNDIKRSLRAAAASPGDQDGHYVTTEFGQVWKPAKPKRKSNQGAHTQAKADLRKTLSNWKARTGISAYYIPYFVGKVWLGENRHKARQAYIGKKGVADCFVATMGCVLACEVKTGAGEPSALQASFRERWMKAGNPHIVYRKPSDLTDCLDQIAGRKGYLF